MDQKILWDCHMHSSFSADSDTPMEEMIQTAADQGLTGICFTEHFDPDYPDTPENLDFSLNIPAYRQKLESLADAFKDQIQVNFGLELGLQPQLAGSFSDLLKEVPFDFVIGSSHVVHGYDPYYPSYFEGRKESACYMEYFESILENIAAFDEMDVYGHIDYVVRYGPNQNRQYSYGRYKEILDEILRTLIRKNVEKMNAKRKKQGLPPKKISEHAKVNFKDLEDAQKMDEKKQAERQKKIQDSTEYYKHADAKPGSIAAKARMVQQFDEKNPKGKKNKN